MNGLELFLQVELALILEQSAANVIVDLALELQQLAFARQRVGE